MSDDLDTKRGLYHKYEVRRVNDPQGKHDGCWYFVLDPHHDEHARNALAAYADSCEDEYPNLARDLRRNLEAEHDPRLAGHRQDDGREQG